MNSKFLTIVLIWCFNLVALSQQGTVPGNGPSSNTYRDIKGPQTHKTFYVENIKKPEKRVVLPHHTVILLVNEPREHAGILNKVNTVECYFDTLLSDSLSVRLINEEIEMEQQHRYSNITNNYYAGNFAESYRKVNVKDIRYLSMKSPTRTTLSRIGVVIMSLSVLTLVASPFAGIGLEGDAKAEKRGQVFVAGLTGFAVAIPLFILGKNKKYGLQPDFDSNGKNHWVLKQTK